MVRPRLNVTENPNMTHLKDHKSPFARLRAIAYQTALWSAIAACIGSTPVVAGALDNSGAEPIVKRQIEIGVARAQCFPIEKLSSAQKQKAEELLLRVCDTEGLYTLVGGVKPMSSGWLSAAFEIEKPNADKLDNLREIVAALRCGEEIESHLSQYARSYDGKVLLEGTIFNRLALQDELGRHAAFWQKWALTPRAEPLGVLLTVEHAAQLERFRGYGYLFGYPDHAVEFFVEAARAQDASADEKLVPRDFLHIPTFERDTNRFVYAVPKGHQPNAQDEQLRARCAPILAEYKKRRAAYIGQDKKGIVQLLRDWFDNGSGRCSPEFARY